MFKEDGAEYDWGKHIDEQVEAHKPEQEALERLTRLNNEMRDMLSDANPESRTKRTFARTLEGLDSGSEEGMKLLPMLYRLLEGMQHDLSASPDGEEQEYYGYTADAWQTERLKRMAELKDQFKKLPNFGPTIEAAA